VSGKVFLERCESSMNFLGRDSLHVSSLTRSIEELRLSANRESVSRNESGTLGRDRL
jgi:hypothetical protein